MDRAEVDGLFPEMDASSAVAPTVRVAGEDLHLAYRLPGCRETAVVTFVGVVSWKYGEPNDEALRQHPLWGHGLTPYNFHFVTSELAGDAMRWVATFHDGTPEVTAHARPIVVSSKHPTLLPSDALDLLLGNGANQELDE